ncbi:TRP-domain-containing protein [Coniochaeta ligniaria NRRL 30616]|uniref:TRP-domain-containing protein n=1 Tax=Coniochaeta ligniaria NRRL 30616 TaxID=1408157 RepID=A0A1J7I8K2_9PEZI|nr:TRP-domain-containing protein [Coniochaeta ligniaria NRRL 30616]
MRFSIGKPLALFCSLAALITPTLADDGPMLQSGSLNTCQEQSGFSASLFNVVFTPNNNSASVNIIAVSSIQGSVVFDVIVSAYGYQITRQTVDPCNAGLAGLCPMTSGKIPLRFNLPVSADALKQLPGIAYTFPDLDAKVKVFINMTDGDRAGESAACVEAMISNGKTVDLLGVKWATAIVAGLALASSALVSGLGHANAASHVAANALSLFGYFQSQAMIGMTGVPLPPVAQSWTQDFQWSMGIIKLEFMQDIFTWYQRATGGTPSTLLDSLTTVSVQVQKRALQAAAPSLTLFNRAVAMMPRGMVDPVSHAAASIAKRGNIQTSTGSYIVYGIQRVAFRAAIESTNVFMTGLVFYCIFVIFTVMCVAAWKGFCELAAKNNWIKHDTFLEFRNGWFTVLKGILFRMTLIGYPQMTVLCLWEFTQNDSAAEMVLAVFFFFGMTITLGWAASKVIRIARRSVAMHRNPAYILFSDPQALNKWGFLYVQFRASAYYFIVPMLGYTLLKGMFLAFAQSKGTVQAVAFIIIEAGALIAASVLRPWMDKSTNSFNIAICAVNFLNAIFLLIFTDVFNQPPLVTGVVGVVLWIANAIFALVLLIMLIVTTVIVFFRENPDARYQYMADDRASFMKSQTQLTTTTELDALAATARGDKGGYKHGLDLDDDADSLSSDSLFRRSNPANMALPPSNKTSMTNMSYNSYNNPPRSPVDPSVPLFPADGQRGPAGPPPYLRNQDNRPPPGKHQSPDNYMHFADTTPSPWQRGAGYD